MARSSVGAAAARPSVTSSAMPSSSVSTARGGPVGDGATRWRRGSPRAGRRHSAVLRTWRRHRRPDRSREPARGRAARAAAPRPAGASAPSAADPWANAICPRSRSTRARWRASSGAPSTIASISRAASNAPACKLACAAASARSTRRPRSGVNATERRRNAAAAASPPRASRDPRSARARRRRPRRARPRPQHDARRDDPRRCAHRLRRRAPGGPPAGPPPTPPDRRPSAPADGGTGPAPRPQQLRVLRGSERVGSDPEAAAARQTSAASPTGRPPPAAATAASLPAALVRPR